MRRGGIIQLLIGVGIVGALVIVAGREGARVLTGVKASAAPSAEQFAPRAAPLLSKTSSTGGAIAPRVLVFGDGTAAVAWLGATKEGTWPDRVETRTIRKDGAAGAPGSTHGKEPFVVSPVLAHAGGGGVWLAFMGTPQSPLDDLGELATLYVARAAPGGLAFAAPINVAQGDAIATWGGTWAAPYGELLALVHRSVEAGRGRIFFSAVGQGDPGAQIVAEGDELATARCAICATSTRAYVVWWEPPGVVKVRASDDGGHFRTTRAVTVSMPNEAVAAVPPSCVAVGDRLELMYGLSTSSPLAAPTVVSRVVLARSVDAGRSFPVRAMLGEPRTRIVASALTTTFTSEPLLGTLVTTPGTEDVILRWARPSDASPGELVLRDVAGKPLPEDREHVAATHGLLTLATGAGRTVAAFAEGPGMPQVSFVELEP
jgi:hypothetical protein